MFSKTQDDRSVAGTGSGPGGGMAAGDVQRPASASRSPTGQRSVLSSDLRIEGIVATEGALEVHGVIEGEVAADTLLIGDDGRVTGKVRATQADLRGTMKGEIVSTRLTLRAAAQMHADATCETLVIESGAHVEGRFGRPASVAADGKPAGAAKP